MKDEGPAELPPSSLASPAPQGVCPIFLTGLSGSGKSTIAPLLARLRGYATIDVDERIAAQAGISIAAIFATEGERGFRDREAAVIADICHAAFPAIIALGAGALERAATRERIAACGRLVFLDAALPTLEARVAADATPRPLLAHPGRLAEQRKRRLPHYQAAELTVTVDGRTPQEIAALIHEALSP